MIGFLVQAQGIKQQTKSKQRTTVCYTLNSKTKEPLYILDGKTISNLANIDSKKVKNITILRDTTATKLYGKKGEYGVIIITTK